MSRVLHRLLWHPIQILFNAVTAVQRGSLSQPSTITYVPLLIFLSILNISATPRQAQSCGIHYIRFIRFIYKVTPGYKGFKIRLYNKVIDVPQKETRHLISNPTRAACRIWREAVWKTGMEQSKWIVFIHNESYQTN